MTFLARIEPERNLRRFYVLQVVPTLSGEWSVMLEWGRIGSPGTVRTMTYGREHEAQAAEQRVIRRRLRRGYSVGAA
jgi:predicted DNA-binding WGR domain protein